MPQDPRHTREQLHALLNATRTILHALHATRLRIGPTVERETYGFQLCEFEEQIERGITTLQTAHDNTPAK